MTLHRCSYDGTQIHDGEHLGEWAVSFHAAQRWTQRIGGTTDYDAAKRLIAHAASRAIVVPNRLATELWLPKRIESTVATRRRQGIRYLLAGRVVLVVTGKTICTVVEASEGQVATVLTWLMTKVWLADSDDKMPQKEG